MQPWMIVVGIVAVYLLITLLLGVIAYRQARVNLEEFLLYGRRAGFIVLYLTVVATFFSAFAFLGASGFFYTHGVGFWEASIWTVVAGAATSTLGPRVWALGKRFGYVTPADLLADFYESEAVRVVAAIVAVLFSIFYLEAQAVGMGYILSIASGGHISPRIASAILLSVTAVYVMVGGMRAVFWTDVMQGAWMYIAIWTGALMLSYKLFGGPLALWREVALKRPDLLTLPGPRGFFTPGMWFGMTVVSLGTIFQPQIMTRYYSAVSARTIRWLGATTPIYMGTFYIPVALIGLGGALLIPNMALPDRIFPELLFRYASPWLTGFILAGACSAAMSATSSILHANMTVLTHDVYNRYIYKQASAAHYIWVGRAIVMSQLLVAYLLSLHSFGFLVVIILLSGAGGLQLMPAVCGVCFPGGFVLSSSGVLAGIAVGLLTLYVTVVLYPNPLTLHGGVWALLANYATAFMVSSLTQGPSAATIDRIHGTLEDLIYGDGEVTLSPVTS
jgi:solute:Na+ symporter, SSS family